MPVCLFVFSSSAACPSMSVNGTMMTSGRCFPDGNAILDFYGMKPVSSNDQPFNALKPKEEQASPAKDRNAHTFKYTSSCIMKSNMVKPLQQ